MNENDSKTDCATAGSKIVLIGGGGHARSVADVLGAGHIAGYVSPEASSALAPLEWLGDEVSFIAKAHSAGTLPPIHIALVSGRDCKMRPRRTVIGRYLDFGHPAVIAEDATVSPTASVAEGCAVMHRAYIGPGSSIGEYSVINTGAIIEHDVHIGANTFVGPGAVICGGVTIGDDCYIGAGSKIRNGSAIAPGTTIGMGAVVTKDITDEGTYTGCPAKRCNNIR